ncbi:MAG: hypothetical protein J6C05_10115 [Prevotella sp.]|nr:hypothetical protein [Prevotella sp.]
MTAMELNAEMYRQLSIIASDENLMRKALNAVKRITAKKIADDSAAKVLTGIDSGLKDVANGNIRPLNEFLEDLKLVQSIRARVAVHGLSL